MSYSCMMRFREIFVGRQNLVNIRAKPMGHKTFESYAFCQTWLDVLALQKGPLFPAIDRWGNVRTHAMHPASFIPLLRALIEKSGIPESHQFSSHSLRRGFASWATVNGWDLKTLMNYIGWKDVRSAMRYVDTNPFAFNALEKPPQSTF